MLPDEKAGCPLTGFKMRCFDGVTKHKCSKWVRVDGQDPQTGKIESFYACNEQMQHLLQLEFNKRMNELGAAMESMRNGMVSVIAHQAIAETERAIETAKAVEQLTAEAPKKLLEVKDAEN